jgi:hypothetical protein
MLQYSKFHVKPEDNFDSFNYPQLVNDLNHINAASIDVPQKLKAEMLISFTKNHSLRNDWIAAYPKFASLITTGALPIGNITSLFEASSKNSLFQKQFELFLQQSINHMTTSASHKHTDD